jgi:hypothetical protein
MDIVRVWDSRGGVFLHPRDVLAACASEANALTWSVLDLTEAFAPEGSDLDVLALRRKVEASTTGLVLDFGALLRLVSGLQQVIDGLFVGCPDAGHLPARDASDQAVLDQADMVLAAMDSTFWVVAAPTDVIDRLRRTFDDVRTETRDSVTLSTWGR